MSASSTPNEFTESNVEGTGKTTVLHPDVDTAPGSSAPDHVHIDFDLAHQACLAEIATLLEVMESDIRIITDRLDDETKGAYVRDADTVANNPANIALQAALEQNLKESGIQDFVNAEIGNPTNFGNTSASNFSSLRNSGLAGGGFSGGTYGQRQAPGYAGAQTVTNQSGQTVQLTDAQLADIVEAKGEATGNVRYGNQGGKRNLPIQQQLMDILDTAATEAGVDLIITSGGQVPTSEGGVSGVNRTGSNRHDKGYGADVALYTPDFNGRQLQGGNSADLAIMMKFMRAARDAGATGIGQGNGYMGNNIIHVDIGWIGQQQGAIRGVISTRTWGGGSSSGTSTNYANAPSYMKELMTPRSNA
jgi:hypothetical protein